MSRRNEGLWMALALIGLLIVAAGLLSACTTPRDGQEIQVDPKAFQIWSMPF